MNIHSSIVPNSQRKTTPNDQLMNRSVVKGNKFILHAKTMNETLKQTFCKVKKPTVKDHM